MNTHFSYETLVCKKCILTSWRHYMTSKKIIYRNVGYSLILLFFVHHYYQYLSYNYITLGTIVFVSVRWIELYIRWPRKVNFNFWPQVKVKMSPNQVMFFISYHLISFDASGQEEHFATYPRALSQSNQKLEPKMYIDLMTSLYDLIWPFQWSHMQICTEVINSSLDEHGSKWLGTCLISIWGSWVFPHWLIMGRSRNWPDLRSPI